MNTTEHMGVKPQNYMTLAIISTILGCCSFYGIGFILGLIAIYFASQVNSRFNSGDLAGAEKNAKNAKILSFAAIGLLILTLLSSLIIYLFFPEMMAEQQEAIRIMMEQIEDAQQQ